MAKYIFIVLFSLTIQHFTAAATELTPPPVPIENTYCTVEDNYDPNPTYPRIQIMQICFAKENYPASGADFAYIIFVKSDGNFEYFKPVHSEIIYTTNGGTSRKNTYFIKATLIGIYDGHSFKPSTDFQATYAKFVGDISWMGLQFNVSGGLYPPGSSSVNTQAFYGQECPGFRKYDPDYKKVACKP